MKLFIIIYAAINFIVFLLYGIDKAKARRGSFRISAASLLIAALLGPVGALLGMIVFHHKTRKAKFCVLVPLILVLELTVAILLCIRYMPRNTEAAVASEEEGPENIGTSAFQTSEINSSIEEPQIQEDYVFINSSGDTLEERINVPKGYIRTPVSDDSLQGFVRKYKMKPDGSPVLLYDGREKGIQSDHIAVFDMAIENYDLQQCADSVMRMYAEYFRDSGQEERIAFHFTNGFLCDYDSWKNGKRVKVNGNDVYWVQSGGYDDSDENFISYLWMVFSYAGTLSLQEESEQIDISELRAGDIFIKGGSPGHVVFVADVCEKGDEKAFLLAQGYMPAQEFHVLKNPLHEDDPWYYVSELSYPLRTPEYTFNEGSLMRPGY